MNIVISETTSTPDDTVQLTAPQVANWARVSMSEVTRLTSTPVFDSPWAAIDSRCTWANVRVRSA